MLGVLATSKVAKAAALATCSVGGTAVVTVSVPKVRTAVHKLTAPPAKARPRQFAKPRIRSAPIQLAATPICPDPVPILLTDTPFSVPDASEAFVFNTPGLERLPASGPGSPPTVFRTGFSGITPNGFTPSGFVAVPLPESQTWVQMIAGFGAIGGAIRLSKRHQGEKPAPGATVS
jgi:hypothetical protein